METRNKIIEKASELFLVMGIRNITMDQIASESGVSKRTIYELFKDKDDLVVQSLRHLMIKDNKEMLGIIDETQHVIEAIFLMVKRETMRRTEYTKIFVEDIRKYYLAVSEDLYSCKKNLKEYSASYALIDKGMREDIFRQDIQIELVNGFLHELITLMENSERIKALKASPEDMLRSIFLPYLRGICTMKGVDLMDQYFENVTEII